MHAAPDTIAAMATPAGRGAIAILRVSGPDVPRIAAATVGSLPPARRATLRDFRGADGVALDTGLALYFPGPRSYTGEDMLEFHGHGGPVVSALLLEGVVAAGARIARPGEFSERAFLNGRIDLARAEAVADLIDAASVDAVKGARRALAGEFSRRVTAIADSVVALRVPVEAATDFADEELDLPADEELIPRLAQVRAELEQLRAVARTGNLLRDGFTVAIVGPPNVGKSTLLNALAGFEAAIVTEHPGTTRDPVRERVVLDGMPLNIVDTAGLRTSGDPVESLGMARTREMAAQADLVLLVTDDRDGGQRPEDAYGQPSAGGRHLRVRNKVDLSGAAPGESADAVRLSARTGAGMQALREALKREAGYAPGEGAVFTARVRHLQALAAASEALAGAAALLADGATLELAAEELRLAHRALGEITGEFGSEALLTRIFASFCIGK